MLYAFQLLAFSQQKRWMCCPTFSDNASELQVKRTKAQGFVHCHAEASGQMGDGALVQQAAWVRACLMAQNKGSWVKSPLYFPSSLPAAAFAPFAKAGRDTTACDAGATGRHRQHLQPRCVMELEEALAAARPRPGLGFGAEGLSQAPR